MRSTYLTSISLSTLIAIARAFEAERGHFQRVRDQGDGEAAVADIEDGEADAVERDRTFLDQVAGLGGGNLESVEARIAFGFNRDDAPDAINVAADQMAADQLVRV